MLRSLALVLFGAALGGPLLAYAAVDAPDYVLVVDRSAAGVVRHLELKEEHPLITSQWAAQRSACAPSLASCLSWFQVYDQAGYSWLTSKSGTDQEGLRQALLSGS